MIHVEPAMLVFSSAQQLMFIYPSIKPVLRRIWCQVDIDFIYNEVRDRCGIKGNVSVPPPVILRL